jgi:hypothetical protein
MQVLYGISGQSQVQRLKILSFSSTVQFRNWSAILNYGLVMTSTRPWFSEKRKADDEIVAHHKNS